MPQRTPAAREAGRRGDAALDPVAHRRALADAIGSFFAAAAVVLRPSSERKRHGELAARREQRAAGAVVRDLLREPRVRHDRKTEPDERGRVVRERAQRDEARSARLRLQLASPAPRRCRDAASPHRRPASGPRRPIGPAARARLRRRPCRRPSRPRTAARGRRARRAVAAADDRFGRLASISARSAGASVATPARSSRR